MKSLALLLAATFAFPSHALLIRPDRDDAEYLELAGKYVSAVRLPTGAGGVLIKDRWILTTAQAAKAIAAAGNGARVDIAGRAYAVDEAIPHPDWRRPGGPNDVGLVLLKDAVRGVAPTTAYSGRDERGRTAVMVGFGATGRIGQASTSADGRKRASINTVDAVGDRALEVRVKPLEDASDLQGALGRDELGAPLYLDGPEGVQVIGIAQALEGGVERFARVSAYYGWIEDTMLEAAKREAAQLLGGTS